MATVYIGVGSNLGDKKANCTKAIELLKASGIVITKESSMYETEPWGLKDQPRFINMAVKARTALKPKELLGVLKAIEKKLGRIPAERFAPRIIDLDILLYDDLILEEPDLIIPHPLMHERDFVLKPLSEIAPEAVHPALKKTVLRLLEEL